MDGKNIKKVMKIYVLIMIIVALSSPITVNALTEDAMVEIANEQAIEVEYEEPVLNSYISGDRVYLSNLFGNDTSTTSTASNNTATKKASPTAIPTATPKVNLSKGIGITLKDGKYFQAVGELTTYPELRKALENKFGRQAMLNDYQNIESNRTLYSTLMYAKKTDINKNLINTVLTSKGRLEIGNIAVKNGLIGGNNWAASGYVPFFYYYGILGKDNGNGAFDYVNSKEVTRKQGAYLLERYMNPSGLAEKQFGSKESDAYAIMGNDVYVAHVNKLGDNMFIRVKTNVTENTQAGVDKKELGQSMTRLEAVYIIMNTYFKPEVDFALKTSQTSSYYFKDIDKATIYSDKDMCTKFGIKYYDDENLVNTNLKARVILKNKVLNKQTDAVIEAAYRIGLLKKDSKGNARLFENVTQSEFIRMLTQISFARNRGFSGTTINNVTKASEWVK